MAIEARLEKNVYAHEALTVSTTAVKLTDSTYKGSANIPLVGMNMMAMVSVETDKVRARLDGINPTSTTGHEYNAGDIIYVYGISNIQNLRMIRSGAADATVRVSYMS